MVIRIIRCRSFDNTIKFVNKIGKDKNIIFRGQQNPEWKLETTYSRFSRLPYGKWTPYFEMLLDHFKSSLLKFTELPIASNNRLDWLEYAQHYGVPTPLLDFTYSPYIALFFAYNGIKKPIEKPKKESDKYVVLYALNIHSLLRHWTTKITNDLHQFKPNLQTRLHIKSKTFDKGFPENELHAILNPGKFSNRMIRQQGCFLYDTIFYKMMGYDDLEDFISKTKDDSGNITLTKIYFRIEWVTEVFEMLELMGINAAMLFMNEEGAAMDAKNAWQYDPKTLNIRDIEFPPPDDKKIQE